MKKQHVELTKLDRDYLLGLSNRKTLEVRVLKRALALLALDQGETLEAVARHQQLTNDTIAQLRNRYKWSLRLLAERIVDLEYCEAISHTQVGQILKKTP